MWIARFQNESPEDNFKLFRSKKETITFIKDLLSTGLYEINQELLNPTTFYLVSLDKKIDVIIYSLPGTVITEEGVRALSNPYIVIREITKMTLHLLHVLILAPFAFIQVLLGDDTIYQYLVAKNSEKEEGLEALGLTFVKSNTVITKEDLL